MTSYSNIQTVVQPEGLNIKLFHHQLTSIYFMEKLEREQMVERESHPIGQFSVTTRSETRLGINADPTGFGKTLAMIGLIVRDKMEWDLDVPFIFEKITTESAGLIRTRVITRYDKLPATLILASPSLVTQWQRELSHTSLVVDVVLTRKDVDRIEAEQCDVIIVTTTMYNNLIKSHSSYAWKRLIFDEPGHTRVPGMKEMNAGFYWFVTATPNTITSQAQELQR